MSTTLTIGGVDKTEIFEFPSLGISDNLNHRNDCSFVLSDQTGAYRPSVGQEVIITKDGTRIFAGSIDEWEEEDLPGQVVEGIIPCVDYNQIADRHLVARVYENQTLGAIVADIVTQDLAGEGITTTNVQSGPTISKAAFNYRTVAEAFNDLSQLTGYDWYIDYYKDLHFFSRETNTAPFSITDISYNYRNMKVRYTREQYRNRQYIRAGYDITDSRTEEFKGDGKTKTFPLSFAVAKVPSAVTVNAVAKTIGIKGIDTGKDWYWNKGEREITQDDAAAALISTDTLAVTYQGLFPIILVSQDDTEISSRASTEGGTGIYEDVEEDANIDSRDLATSKADALLRRFGRIPRIITFETDTGGLRAGQLINITNARRNLSDNFLIESVTARAEQLDLVYSVKALDGEALGGWVEFFQKLAQSTRKFVIRENEVLGLLRRFSDAIVLVDTLTTAISAPLRLEVGAMFYSDVGQVAELLPAEQGPPPPNQAPTVANLAATNPGSTGVDLAADVNDAEGNPLDNIHIQITTAADTTWSTPVVDINLTSAADIDAFRNGAGAATYRVAATLPAGSLMARVRASDNQSADFGGWSNIPTFGYSYTELGYCLGSAYGTQASGYWSWRGWVATTNKVLQMRRIGFRQHSTKPGENVRVAVVRLNTSNVIQEIYGQHEWTPADMGPPGDYYDNWYTLPAVVEIPSGTRIAILSSAPGGVTWAPVSNGLAPGSANSELTIYGRIQTSLGHYNYPLTTGGTATVVTTGTPTVDTAGNQGQLVEFEVTA